MRAMLLLFAVGCSSTQEGPELDDPDAQERTHVCHTLHTGPTDGVAVARIEVEAREQTPSIARFQVEGVELATVRTRNIGRLGSELVTKLTIDGEYHVVALNLETEEVTEVRPFRNEIGGQGELVTPCGLGDDLCVYSSVEGVGSLGEAEFVSGPVGQQFETRGETFLSIDQDTTEMGVWNRDGSSRGGIELEGFNGWSLGFSATDDRLFVLEDGLFAIPAQAFPLLRVYDREGTLLDTIPIDGIPSSGFVSGLTCQAQP